MTMMQTDPTQQFYDSHLHLPKAEIPAVLEGFKRILGPKGIFALGMKVGQGEGYVSDQRYGGAKKYFANFEVDEMEELLQEAGFAIIASSVRERQLPYQDLPAMEILARKGSTASRS